MDTDAVQTLLKEAKAFYRIHARRELPWRKTRDPYRILVSEVMLQQTQADRVAPFYRAFIKKFPTASALAAAGLPEVLALWQGLGYNRRGKMLRDAARVLRDEFGGRFPREAEALEALPGVGPYTARAVLAFAFNQPQVFVETNIRAVFIRHCFSNRRGKISDAELLPLVERALEQSRMAPREFYAMLMDYGSFLKKSGLRTNALSAHYVRQSRFEGSSRQLRGRILKFLLDEPLAESEIAARSKRSAQETRQELARLAKDGLLARNGKKYRIAR